MKIYDRIDKNWLLSSIFALIVFGALYFGIVVGVTAYVEHYHPEAMPIPYCTNVCASHSMEYYNTENAGNTIGGSLASLFNTGCHQCLCINSDKKIQQYCL